MRLEHINITVADLDRSIAFYTKLLDLRIRWQGHTVSGKRAVHVGDTHWYIAMFEAGDGQAHQDYGQPGFNHFGVVVDDLEQVKARIADLGVSIALESSIDDPSGKGRNTYMFDPDGHEIELIEYKFDPGST